MTEDKQKKVRIENIMLNVMLIFGFLMFGILYAFSESENVCFNNETVYEISDGWRASSESGTDEVMLPVDLEAQKGETVVFERVLNDGEILSDSILFRSFHQFVDVWLDGELLHTYGRKSVGHPNQSPGCAWQIVRLPREFDGKTLRIELTSVYENEAGKISGVYMGTKSALVLQVMRMTFPAVLMNIPIALLGIILIVLSMFFKNPASVRKIRSFGILALNLSLWILMESKIAQIYTGNIQMTLSLLFVVFDLLPVSAIYFLRSYQEVAKSRVMKGLFVLAVVNDAVSLLLLVYGLEDGMKSLWRVHILLVLMMLEFLHVIYRCHKEHKRGEEVEMFYRLLLVLAFAAMDMLSFYFNPGLTDNAYFMRFGLIYFVAVNGISVLVRESRKRVEYAEQQVLKKLAYTDMMTGLANRTAFEEKMQEYRDGKRTDRPYIIVADLNHLKIINDYLGHTAGDNALKWSAEALEKYFGEYGSVYRIGGDEFCVISEELLTEEKLRKQAVLLEESLKDKKLDEYMSVELAVGWTRVGDDGIDAAFTAADHLMYEKKEKMHK